MKETVKKDLVGKVVSDKNDKTIKMCILKILSEINLGIVMKVYFPENGCANMKNNKIYFME